MSIPRKHHYLPKFYIRQWSSSDGRVCRYLKNQNGVIHRKWKYPKAIGFEKDLYSRPELNPNVAAAQEIETGFFSPIDDKAAKILPILIEHGPDTLTPQQRAMWSYFITTLFHRTPRYLATLERAIEQRTPRILSEIEQNYNTLKGLEDPDNYPDWKSQRPENIDAITAKQVLPGLIAKTKIPEYIYNLRWVIGEFDESTFPLILSDHPLIYKPIHTDQGHIGMPLAPQTIFFASEDQSFFDYLNDQSDTQLATATNKHVVGNAEMVVVATDQKQDRFIRNRFGAEPVGSLLGA